MNAVIRRGCCYGWVLFMGAQAMQSFRRNELPDGFAYLAFGLLLLGPALSK